MVWFDILRESDDFTGFKVADTAQLVDSGTIDNVY
jgi:hypothetical protein